MRSHPSLSASESASSHPVFSEALHGHADDVPPELDGTRGEAPPSARTSGSRVKSVSPAHTGLGATELYFRELAGSHPLTREGEAAIGRRIEEGLLAGIDAWVRSPIALRELALTAEDIEIGSLSVRDLLEADVDDATEEVTSAQLTQQLQLARSLFASQQAGADVSSALGELAAGLAALRLDPVLGERLERSLREAAAHAEAAERVSYEATLATISRARRAVSRAKAELVEANLRLAVTIARDHQRFGVPLLDLVQEGNLGLIRAADKFEYRRGHRFGTYAAWWIKQAIKRALLNQGKPIRMPVHLADIRSHVVRARRSLVQESGREPSIEEIAERSGLPVEKVRVIGEFSLEPLSLDAPVGDGDTRYGDLLANEEPTPADALVRRRLVEQTRDLLDSLLPREREILRRRYGLDGDEDETLEEIGQSFSLTRERIRQIEAKALEKLRSRSRQRELGSYLER